MNVNVNVQVDVQRLGREQVVTLKELLAAGVTRSAVDHRRRNHWQEPLPRVFVLHNGPLTWRQKFHAALCYAGPGARLTSLAVLALHGFRDAPSLPSPSPSPPPSLSSRSSPSSLETVHVLLPSPLKRRSVSYVKVARARHLPPRPTYMAGFPCVPLPWALADACAGIPRPGCLYEAVQRHRVGAEALREAFRTRQVPVGGELAAVLADLAAGAHSVAEGWARRLIARSGLPEPLWNPDLFLDGEWLCRPDAYWPEHGVVLEVDSVRHHQLGADFQRTTARHARISAAGLCVLPVTPAHLRDAPHRFLSALTQALSHAPYPGVPRVSLGRR
ncbi:hypothetical protein ABT026_14410 [Streptomyces sp. NPDC002734]|uniref:hypothetical protein n=1 Tax=Streptomyces sp. NPDC002734 TaxID=3154426 RepID=UPI003325DDA6